eukprot:m51a1_g8508 putative serine threonine-protein kinase chk2 (519) ;mRNA; f:72779-74638
MAEATQALDYTALEEKDAAAAGDAPRVWGRLRSRSPGHPDVDLVEREVVLGRQSACQVRYEELAVSGRHCRIVREGPGAVWLEDLSTNGTFVDGLRVGRGLRRALAPGMEVALLLRDPGRLAYVYTEVPGPAAASAAAPEGDEELRRKYDVTAQQLGAGNFAVVRLGLERATGRRVAVKVIDKKRFASLAAGHKDRIMEEVQILQRLDHGNIIRILDVVDTASTLYLVLELVTGGTLEDLVLERGGLAEDAARALFVQAATALRYLHSMGIAHRDIKPENLLLQDKQYNFVKLSDFGLSKEISDGELTKTICGTPQYLAPEVFAQAGAAGAGYTKAVDIWSLGCILYYMLCGCSPFAESRDGLGILQLISSGRYDTSRPAYARLSACVKDLIERMLVVEPARRLSAAQVLEHPWSRGESSLPADFPPQEWRAAQGSPSAKRSSEDAGLATTPCVKRTRTQPMAADAGSSGSGSGIGGGSSGGDLRPLCKYGEKCYRKNPQHLAEFRHPHLEQHVGTTR